eukprot:jgi/Chrzof1/5835/Cz16g17180.t1
MRTMSPSGLRMYAAVLVAGLLLFMAAAPFAEATAGTAAQSGCRWQGKWYKSGSWTSGYQWTAQHLQWYDLTTLVEVGNGAKVVVMAAAVVAGVEDAICWQWTWLLLPSQVAGGKESGTTAVHGPRATSAVRVGTGARVVVVAVEAGGEDASCRQ